MKKLAVVYWSGTGNTAAMAQAILDGAGEAGAETAVFLPDSFQAGMIGDYDVLAFGCSAQGAEVLEEAEFDPMFTDIEAALKDKPVALFGSYGWGDGEWMRNWEDRCRSAGIPLMAESLIINEMPDEVGLEQCRAWGKALVE